MGRSEVDRAKESPKYKAYRLIWTSSRKMYMWAGSKMIYILKEADKKDGGEHA